ncbi:hypothetical protein V2J09_008200 [Rumex salicifolius]
MDFLTPPRGANTTPQTPLTFLERAAAAYPDTPSLIHEDVVVSTWPETHRRCLRLSSALISILGIRPRDVVSAFLPNIPAMYELQFAVPMAGAVLNNLNTRLDPRSTAVLLHHSLSKAIFLDSNSLPLILSAVSLLPKAHPRPALIVVDPEVNGRRFSYYSYEDLVSQGDPGFDWVRPESEYDPIVLNYTSGTTSNPKGVVHSHRGAFVKTVDAIIEWPLPRGPVYLWTLPMFHANGWSYVWATAAVGGTNVCMRKFVAGDVFDAIARHGVTHMCGAPVVLNMLANAAAPGGGEEKKRRLERPVEILTAGAPPPSAVLERAEELGFVVSHGYGLTETAGLVVTCPWQHMDVIDTATGKSVNRDGQSIGEVVLRGNTLMLGYLNDPDATSNCMGEDGWFRTGDVGVMHTDGYLEIKDRSKDVIISGGENISSVEVESVLYTNPAVNEAAVVARPDEHWGESPCAFLSLKPGLEPGPSEEEVMEYCRANMPHYMVPRTVVFKNELPKTATGKIQKFLLRDAAKALGPRVARDKPIVKARGAAVNLVAPSPTNKFCYLIEYGP